MGYAKSRQNLYENGGRGPRIKLEVVPGSFIGDIRPLPYGIDELAVHAPGWYGGNGDLYQLSSPQGQALFSLSESFKARWRIAVSGEYINLPDFNDEDGRGYFIRGADGVERLVGSIQGDAMRRIKGQSGLRCFVYHSNYTIRYYPTEPPFNIKEIIHPNTSNYGTGADTNDEIRLEFDSQLSLPDNTADEFRPANIAMTIGIYLGVEQ